MIRCLFLISHRCVKKVRPGMNGVDGGMTIITYFVFPVGCIEIVAVCSGVTTYGTHETTIKTLAVIFP